MLHISVQANLIVKIFEKIKYRNIIYSQHTISDVLTYIKNENEL